MYKLCKALCWLEKAPRAWYSKLENHLRKQEFNRSENEPTLYIKKASNLDLIIVCVYVDGIIYTSSSKAIIDELKVQMKGEFEMSDMG